MIVINGTVSDRVKQQLLDGKPHPTARRHGNIIIAGSNSAVDGNRMEIVLTGSEAFTFQSSDNTVYYKNSDFINVPHANIVYAYCTHFKWDDGAIIADLDDGCFLFNYTKATGIGTGNVSFKRKDLFTSLSVAKAWLKEQYDKGTPVTVVAYIKE